MRFIQFVVLLSVHAPVIFGSAQRDWTEWDNRVPKEKEWKYNKYKVLLNEPNKTYIEDQRQVEDAISFWSTLDQERKENIEPKTNLRHQKVGEVTPLDSSEDRGAEIQNTNVDGPIIRGNEKVESDPFYAAYSNRKNVEPFRSYQGFGGQHNHQSAVRQVIPSGQNSNVTAGGDNASLWTLSAVDLGTVSGGDSGDEVRSNESGQNSNKHAWLNDTAWRTPDLDFRTLLKSTGREIRA